MASTLWPGAGECMPSRAKTLANAIAPGNRLIPTAFEPALALAEMEAPCAARANVALQHHAGQRSSSASLRSIAYPAAFVAVGTGDACGCKY